MSDNRPIGMFDSGFGGLTVARAVMDLLPYEELIYLGDTGRYPYGERPLSEVKEFAHQLGGELVRRGVKMVVVACNTASAAALDSLREELPVPVIGVIEPGARTLVRATRWKRVGVIGTPSTIASGVYREHIEAIGGIHTLVEIACPGFVEFVERGEFDSPELTHLAEELLAPAHAAGIDALLLGCTHYPYLRGAISRTLPAVKLISSAEQTAYAVADELEAKDMFREAGIPEQKFITTGDVNDFEQVGRKLLGPELERAEEWLPERS